MSNKQPCIFRDGCRSERLCKEAGFCFNDYSVEKKAEAMLTSKERSLLPCPFCGAPATIETIESKASPGDLRFSAGCNTEDCIGYQSVTTFARRGEAATSWNRRTLSGDSYAPETLTDETSAWLIEMAGERAEPLYWHAEPDMRCIGGFDPDVNKAMRFCREQDARAMALMLGAKGMIALTDVRHVRITEHAWTPSAQETKPESWCQVCMVHGHDTGNGCAKFEPMPQKIPPRDFDIESHQGTYTEKVTPEWSCVCGEPLPDRNAMCPKCFPVKASADEIGNHCKRHPAARYVLKYGCPSCSDRLPAYSLPNGKGDGT